MTAADAERIRVGGSLRLMQLQLEQLRMALGELQRLAQLAEGGSLFSLALLRSTLTARFKTMQAELKYAVAEAYASQAQRLESRPLRGPMGDLKEVCQELGELEALARGLELQALESRGRLKELDGRNGELQKQLLAAQEESEMLLEREIATRKELRIALDGLSHAADERTQAAGMVEGQAATIDAQAGQLQRAKEEAGALAERLDQQTVAMAKMTQEMNQLRQKSEAEGIKLTDQLVELRAANEKLQNEVLASKNQQQLAVVLRIELERLKESSQKEKRRLELIIADLQDQLELLEGAPGQRSSGKRILT